eukprot:maker-scaffold_5-snap-gene-2.43-mRNA-1 protein AED:0.43 eAED:0.43 QI:0/0/0/0.6/0.75/0.6/5/0/1706
MGKLRKYKKVRARFQGGKNFYPGKISSVNRDGTYDIQYDDGDFEAGVSRKLIQTETDDEEDDSITDKKSPRSHKSRSGYGSDGGGNYKHVTKERSLSRDAKSSRKFKRNFNSSASLESTESRTNKFKVNDRVDCRFGGKAKFYPGKITWVNKQGRYTIDYEDGDQESDVSQRLIRKRKGFVEKDKGPSSSEDSVKMNDKQTRSSRARRIMKNLSENRSLMRGNCRSLRSKFELHDINDDGFVTLLNFSKCLRQLNIEVTNREIKELSDAFKRKRDNKINYTKLLHDLQRLGTGSSCMEEETSVEKGATIKEVRKMLKKYGSSSWSQRGIRKLERALEKVSADLTIRKFIVTAINEKVSKWTRSNYLQLGELFKLDGSKLIDAKHLINVLQEAIFSETPQVEAGSFEEGDKVEARFGQKAKFYPGKIIRVHSDGSCDILYDDGDREKCVFPKFIRKMQRNNSSRTKFHKGQKIEAKFGAGKKYYPGKVANVDSNGFLEIVYDDGDRERNVDPKLVRSREKHSLSSSSSGVASRSASDDGEAFEVGSPVLSPFKGSRKKYPGTISKIDKKLGKADVEFDDGDKEKAIEVHKLELKAVVGEPKFEIGDIIEARFKAGSKFFPGKISRVRQNKTYDIQYNDGDVETRVEEKLIRVTAKSSDGDGNSGNSNTSGSGHQSSSPSMKKGTKVFAAKNGSGKFSSAVVVRDLGKGGVQIRFDDGLVQNVKPQDLVTKNDSNEKVSTGQQLLSPRSGSSKLHPATVLKVHRRGKTADVEFSNGKKEKGVAIQQTYAMKKTSDQTIYKYMEREEVYLKDKVKGTTRIGEVISRRVFNKRPVYDVRLCSGKIEKAIHENFLRTHSPKKKTLRQKASNAENNSSPSQQKKLRPVSVSASLSIGDQVFSLENSRDKELSSGKIIKCRGGGIYDLKFNSGKVAKKVEAADIKREQPVESLVPGSSSTMESYTSIARGAEAFYSAPNAKNEVRVTVLKHQNGKYAVITSEGRKIKNITRDMLKRAKGTPRNNVLLELSGSNSSEERRSNSFGTEHSCSEIRENVSNKLKLEKTISRFYIQLKQSVVNDSSKKYKKVFETYDKVDSGHISLSNFKLSLQLLGVDALESASLGLIRKRFGDPKKRTIKYKDLIRFCRLFPEPKIVQEDPDKRSNVEELDPDQALLLNSNSVTEESFWEKMQHNEELHNFISQCKVVYKDLKKRGKRFLDIVSKLDAEGSALFTIAGFATCLRKAGFLLTKFEIKEIWRALGLKPNDKSKVDMKSFWAQVTEIVSQPMELSRKTDTADGFFGSSRDCSKNLFFSDTRKCMTNYTKLKQVLKDALSQKLVSSEEDIFYLFDVNSNGFLDQKIFMNGIDRLGLNLSAGDRLSLFRLIVLKHGTEQEASRGTLSKEAFLQFLSSNPVVTTFFKSKRNEKVSPVEDTPDDLEQRIKLKCKSFFDKKLLDTSFLQSQFKALDKKQVGLVSQTALKKVILKLKLNLSAEEFDILKERFRGIYKEETLFNYRKFLNFLQVKDSKVKHSFEKLKAFLSNLIRQGASFREAFDLFDKKKRGTVDSNDLRSVLISAGEVVSKSEIDEVFRKLDLDCDGLISAAELKIGLNINIKEELDYEALSGDEEIPGDEAHIGSEKGKAEATSITSWLDRNATTKEKDNFYYFMSVLDKVESKLTKGSRKRIKMVKDGEVIMPLGKSLQVIVKFVSKQGYE